LNTTFLEKKPNNTNSVSKIGRIPHRIIKELGGSYKVNKNSKRSYKEAI